MITLAQGGCQYRTRLLPQQLAQAFARCLRANDRFTGVMVQESRTAKHPTDRYLVLFHPSNPEALAALVQGQQAIQHQRAAEQWQNYLVVQSDRGAWYYVENLESGEVYEVDPRGTCSCPHYEARCRPALLECKHPGIVRLQLEAGWALTWENASAGPSAPRVPVQTVPSAEQLQRREQVAQDREALWGP